MQLNFFICDGPLNRALGQRLVGDVRNARSQCLTTTQAQGTPINPDHNTPASEETVRSSLNAAEQRAGRAVKEAWTLMDRTARVRLSKNKPHVLAKLSSIAGKARLTELQKSDAQEQYKELAGLLPGFEKFAARMKPALLAELMSDTSEVARRIMQLHQQLPHVDIAALVQSRPSLLSHEEFEAIPAGIHKLERVFGASINYSHVVQQFPIILLLDAEQLFVKLQQQLGPAITPGIALGDPSLLMSVADNRNLSIW